MAAKQEVAAGAVVYDSEIKKYLLLKHRQGHWAFAQGKPEGDEKLSETLVRELKEETGLSINKSFGPVCEVVYKFSYRRKKVVKTVKFWAVLAKGKVRISSEHKGYLWASYKEAKRLLRFKNHTDSLSAARKELKKQKLL